MGLLLVSSLVSNGFGLRLVAQNYCSVRSLSINKARQVWLTYTGEKYKVFVATQETSLAK